MIRTAAVIAHYDPLNVLDPTFLRVIFCLKHYCDHVVLVTTSNLDQMRSLKILASRQLFAQILDMTFIVIGLASMKYLLWGCAIDSFSKFQFPNSQ